MVGKVQTTRELGDWAEDVVKRGVESAGLGFHGVRYGRSENLVAGEPGFKQFYADCITELRQYGKRPDILVYHGVKHFYVQVIFGAVYAISFEKILELLVVGPSKGGYTIDREPRNQFKSTIYIPLSLGSRLSTKFTDPDLSAFKRQLSTGRMLFGVKFSGGDVMFNPQALGQLLT